MRAGDVVSFRLAGAGGYGPPEDRDLARIEKDIEDGLLTEAKARELYPAALQESVKGRARKKAVQS